VTGDWGLGEEEYNREFMGKVFDSGNHPDHRMDLPPEGTNECRTNECFGSHSPVVEFALFSEAGKAACR
jgi:hypothetical protein